MFGVNGAELVVLLVIAAVVVGPERLPGYAEQLARWVRVLRATVASTRERLSTELGDDDIDWAALDPRRFDPRRIVRDALAGTDPASGPGRPRPYVAAVDGHAPFDDEAT